MAAAEQRAAEERARQEAARQAAEEEKKQPAFPILAGTSWSGEAALANENANLTLPITLSIDGGNRISGELIFQVEEDRQRLPLQGTYDPQTGSFDAKFELTAAEGGFRGTLIGSVKSPSAAEGQATLTISVAGMESATVKGTWRVSRR